MPSIAEPRLLGEQTIAGLSPLPAEATLTNDIVASRAALWISMPDSESDRVVLYLHGGGYVLGSIISHQGLAARIASVGRARALIIDYRMAPEAPFPAAVLDSIAAYEYLLQSGVEPRRIVVAGDPAGGGLASATLIAAREKGLELPGAAVVISPWADLTNSGDAIISKASEDPVLNASVLSL